VGREIGITPACKDGKQNRGQVRRPRRQGPAWCAPRSGTTPAQRVLRGNRSKDAGRNGARKNRNLGRGADERDANDRHDAVGFPKQA